MTVLVRVQKDEVLLKLGRLDRALSGDMLEGFLKNAAVPEMQERSNINFEEQGTSEGPWDALKEITQQYRAQQGYNPAFPINVRSGAMRDFVTSSPGVSRSLSDGAEVTFPGPAPDGGVETKFETAQIGDSRTVPRPVVTLDAQDAATMLGFLDAWIHLFVETGTIIFNIRAAD